jgi:hypothetical protein
VELEHRFNLGDAGAVFYRLGEQEEGADPFPLELSAAEIDEMSRDGTTIVSSVTSRSRSTGRTTTPVNTN